MYRPTDGPTITTMSLPSGDRGTRKTLDNMMALAAAGSRDIAIRETVANVVRSAGVDGHDIAGQVAAWFHYVRDAIYFLNDPVTSEWLQSPRYTLAMKLGDCDDRATLLAAGLMSIGIPARFKVVALDRSRPGTMSHVYVVANVWGQTVPLDPTYSDSGVGYEPPNPTRAVVYA